MVKTGLKIYKNNIWHFFTILGFVALGLIIALSIIIPNMSNTITKSANDITTYVKGKSWKFDTNAFFGSLYDQFKAMDWHNPFDTLKQIFTQTKLVEIFTNACTKAGLDPHNIEEMLPIIDGCAKSVINSSVTQLYVLITCLASCSIIGYVLIKTAIHFKSTNNYSLIRYIINLALSILFIGFIMYLFAATANGTDGAVMWIALIGVTLLQVIGELTISFLTYKNKGVKYRDIVNLKTIIGSILAALVIVGLSFAIVAIIYAFNQLAAVMIAVPLLIITMIIVDTVTNTFVTNYIEKV